MVVGLRWVLSKEKNSTKQKTPAHLVGHSVHSRPCVWKRLHCVGFPDVSGADCKRRRCNQHDDGVALVFHKTGVG